MVLKCSRCYFTKHVLVFLFFVSFSNGADTPWSKVAEFAQKTRSAVSEKIDNGKEALNNKLEGSQTVVAAVEKITNVKDAAVEKFGNSKVAALERWDKTRSLVGEKIDNGKEALNNKLEGSPRVKAVVEKLTNGKTAVADYWDRGKTIVGEKIEDSETATAVVGMLVKSKNTAFDTLTQGKTLVANAASRRQGIDPTKYKPRTVWNVAPLHDDKEKPRTKNAVAKTSYGHSISCVVGEDAKEQCKGLAEMAGVDHLHYVELMTGYDSPEMLDAYCTSDLANLPEHFKNVCMYPYCVDNMCTKVHVFDIRVTKQGSDEEICRTTGFRLTDNGAVTHKVSDCSTAWKNSEVMQECLKKMQYNAVMALTYRPQMPEFIMEDDFEKKCIRSTEIPLE